jgi:hypothetical protein
MDFLRALMQVQAVGDQIVALKDQLMREGFTRSQATRIVTRLFTQPDKKDTTT